MNERRIFDAIIIGAGSIGVPAAFFLSRSGITTLVVDKFPSVGQGSNKKAIGGIRATHSDPAKIRLCQRSIDYFSTWQEIYGDEIEWYRGGYLFPVYHPREAKILKDLLVTQKGFGLNIDWLDQQALMNVVPDLNPENLIGGTYSPDDGNASPLLAIHAFYRHAKEYGAQFSFHDPVMKIIKKQTGFEVVSTKNTYSCKFLINAAGPWANEVGTLLGMDLPVTPDSHESAITEPVARFLNPMIVDIRPTTGSSNFYFYQHFTGQIVFCITPHPPKWGFDEQETSEFLPMVARRLIEIMPRLKNIRVRRTWRGLYPMTPDGAPLVGWVEDIPGLILAVGMCGQGFMLGPGIGELLSRMITNSLEPEDTEIISILSPHRQFSQQELLK